jgi:serine/threonine protein kinase
MVKLDYYENSSKLKSKDDKVEILDDVAYNSPELLSSNQINLKYDIWCLGWVFFEMCTIDFPRYKLEDVRDFEMWEKPDLPDFFPAELNKIFRK